MQVIVIGKKATRVTEDEALDHVFGYTMSLSTREPASVSTTLRLTS